MDLFANLHQIIEERREALAAVVDYHARGGAQSRIRFRELDDALARAAPLLGFDHPAIIRLSKAAINGVGQWP